ncbi:hypothetical protein B0H14DRAFT_3733983 [Mycena olivaceomarginata]|nr:hypothetical protein B0H14DRAFT_3733983 [Mycena olivaceomarginata]
MSANLNTCQQMRNEVFPDVDRMIDNMEITEDTGTNMAGDSSASGDELRQCGVSWLPSPRVLPATMDDIQLVAHVAAGDLLAFRDSLRAFLAGRDASTSTCQSTISVKLEPSQASVSIRPQETRVKTEDSGSPTIDLTSPARPAVRTRQFVENRKEIIEILSSDDEMEVEASLWPSGASSDPPDPSDSLDHNDSDDEPEDLASVALLTTFWGDTNIISRAIVGPATINRQGKVERVEYLDQIPSFFPVPRKKTAYILDLRDEHFDYVDADGVPLRADRFDFEQGWDTDIVFANADVDERNIVHFSRTRNPTKRALETVGTTVQSKAKENQE